MPQCSYALYGKIWAKREYTLPEIGIQNTMKFKYLQGFLTEEILETILSHGLGNSKFLENSMKAFGLTFQFWEGTLQPGNSQKTIDFILISSNGKLSRNVKISGGASIVSPSAIRQLNRVCKSPLAGSYPGQCASRPQHFSSLWSGLNNSPPIFLPHPEVARQY